MKHMPVMNRMNSFRFFFKVITSASGGELVHVRVTGVVLGCGRALACQIVKVLVHVSMIMDANNINFMTLWPHLFTDGGGGKAYF